MRRIGQWIGAALLALLASAAVMLAWVRSPIDARPFVAAPDRRADLPLQQPEPLRHCERMGVEQIRAPEELEIDGQGRVYAGTEDGTIVRLRPDAPNGAAVEVIATPGGRPNGVTLDRQDRLIVSDGYEVPPSLIDADGTVHRLDVLQGGDTAVGSDGTVYSSFLPRFRRSGDITLDFVLLLLEAQRDGELRAYDPRSGRVTVLASGLFIPDGVALSANEEFVAVGEFGAYRIARYWLKGPRAGTTDTLIDDLPGSPDGLAADGAGTFYVALPLRRSAALDWFHRHPWLKDQLAKLLWTLSPPLSGGADHLVLAVDETGRITRAFTDPDQVAGGVITTAEPRDGHLFLGSLVGRGITRCSLVRTVR
jgi:sugar lactone lactonase YvrE